MNKKKKNIKLSDLIFKTILILFSGSLISLIVFYFLTNFSFNIIATSIITSIEKIKLFFVFIMVSILFSIILSFIWALILSKISLKIFSIDKIKNKAKKTIYVLSFIFFSISSSLSAGYVLTDIFIDRSGLDSEKIIMPDLNGMKVQQALEILYQKGLDSIPISNLHYSIIDSDSPESTIIKQDPPAGISIVNSSSIEIWIKISQVEIQNDSSILIPFLLGLKTERAVSLLNSRGFKVEVESIYSDTIENGLVIETSPESGERLTYGSKVYIYISIGSAPVEVPYLVGLTLIEAENLLEEYNFDISISEERTSSLPPFTIIEQDPDSGEKLQIGSIISVIISKEEMLDTIEF